MATVADEVEAKDTRDLAAADREVFRLLGKPFARDEIKTRVQGGTKLSYITARTARKRLNEVLGPSNWWCELTPGDVWVKCRLWVRLPSGVIFRDGMGGYPKMPTADDAAKGGASDALKIAAVQFGVGEYLYGDILADYQPLEEHEAVEAQPRPSGTNNSGHGKGNYAPPNEVKNWSALINLRCEEWNGRWHDHWFGEYGDWPAGVPADFVHPTRLINKVIKVAKDAGIIAVDGDGKHTQSLGVSALVWMRDRDGVEARLEQYLGQLFAAERGKAELKLNPTPAPEDDGDDAYDDEAILATEGGRQG